MRFVVGFEKVLYFCNVLLGFIYLLHVAFLNLFLWLGVSKSLAPIPVFAIVIPINFLLVRFVFKKM